MEASGWGCMLSVFWSDSEAFVGQSKALKPFATCAVHLGNYVVLGFRV